MVPGPFSKDIAPRVAGYLQLAQFLSTFPKRGNDLLISVSNCGAFTENVSRLCINCLMKRRLLWQPPHI